ncbi:MAG: uroporphyrinogen-III C-methyltransferase, partial [Bacteroidia bacterium]
ELSGDIKLAAQTKATVVILMGLNKLTEITATFKEAGRGHTAVALIQNGSLPDERIALGTIGTIETIAKEQNIQAPAVIIIGDVVQQHRNFPAELLKFNYHLN